jgi:translocation and assembly module TamB
VRAVGSLAATRGGGNARITAGNLAQAQRWLLKLPGIPEAVGAQRVAGRGELQLAWQGGWEDPTIQGTLTLPQVQADSPVGQGSAWMVRDATARVDGRLADARLDLRGQGRMGAREATIDLAGRGGRRNNGAWQGQVGTLTLGVRDPAVAPGPWRIVLRRPMDVSWNAGRLEAGASEATLAAPLPGPAASTALLSWDPLTWAGGQLRTSGRLAGLPMAWLELAGGPQLAGSALRGDLVFDAQWDAVLGENLRLRANLARRSGDVSVLAENAEGTSTRVQAGVREARVSIEGDGEAVTVGLQWDSERAGNAQGRVATRLARTGEGWSWPETAPLSGQLRAQLPRLGVWSLLAPPGWRLRGSLAADVTVAGTRADPSMSGNLQADDLALRSVVDGVALQDGRLRARLDGRRLLLDEFILRGTGPAGGSLSAGGEGSWLREGPQVRVTAKLDRLRASSRSERELTLSGQVSARLDASGADVRGGLRVDRARITLPDEAAPRLGDDVVVRNLPPGVALGAQRRSASGSGSGSGGSGKAAGRSLALAVNLDLGNDFRIQGRGISTRLEGTVLVAGDSLIEPRLTGVINTAGGEYRAYGQRLDIERGVLRFTGPIDNPALDILAVRPRLTQRVGVQVTGTAQAPFVRLYAEPDLPEAEKLSWLVLGRPAAEGGAETALLQQAAVALLASRTGGRTGGRGPAGLLGLDELSFKREGVDGPAVTLGKRLGQNLYAAYERSLSGALGTLYVFYDLSQRLTLRAQAGERAAVDLIYKFAYD